MPPEDRFVCRFAAEPPQDPLPYGRWADTLQAEFLAACLKIDTEGTELGDPGSMTWFPDRTWAGRTFVPVTSRTSNGLDLFGYVSFTPGDEDSEPGDFYSWADFTDETADRHPEWKMDLCEEVIGGWRGENGNVAAMTLVWGVPLVRDVTGTNVRPAHVRSGNQVIEPGSPSSVPSVSIFRQAARNSAWSVSAQRP